MCVVNSHLKVKVMRSAIPHSGVEPCVGPKTIGMVYGTCVFVSSWGLFIRVFDVFDVFEGSYQLATIPSLIVSPISLSNRLGSTKGGPEFVRLYSDLVSR